MGTLFFAAYLILFAWLVTKVKFFTKSGLTSSQLIILFLLKVMAGIVYGWIGVYYGGLARMVDTWQYHYASLHEYDVLKHDPWKFFTDIFYSPYDSGYGNFFSGKDSWWNDLKGSLFIKVLAIFNVLSFGHYYINVVIYSFVTMFGPVALYRVMKDVFPSRKIVVLLASFLIPSFLFWTSGLHRDSLIFVGFSIVAYQLYFGFKQQRFSFKRMVCIFLGFLIVLCFRNFYVIPLIPPILAWIFAEKLKLKPILVYSAIYLLFIVLFFAAKYVSPKLDFPNAVSKEQQAFIQLEGGSTIKVNPIEPTVTSFIKNMPQAAALTMLRPYPKDVRHLLSLAAAIEIYFLLLLFALFLFVRKNGVPVTPFLLFCIFFSISILLMIGYTVNNMGAIVRYRSVILPFLVVPMVAKINWHRIGELFLGDINKNKNS